MVKWKKPCISVAPVRFCCPVGLCLNLLKDPVALPCGHSSCIIICWDRDDQKGVYQCRKSFTPRPVVSKNIILAEIVEKQNEKTLQSVAHYVGPEDVECM